jgi:hypothetical protein
VKANPGLRKHIKTVKLSITATSDAQIRANLNAWFDCASLQNIEDGKAWYIDAQTFCRSLAKEFDVNPYICASVVSCLSPNNKWQRNKIDARAVLVAWQAGLTADSVKVCTYNANKAKAFRVLSEGEAIASSAPKTHAFAMNVGLLSADHITIDKWHVRACLTKPIDGVTDTVETVTDKQYRRIEAITAQIAKVNGFNLQRKTTTGDRSMLQQGYPVWPLALERN